MWSPRKRRARNNTGARSCALAIVWLTSVLAPLVAHAAEDSGTGTFSFVLENDLFYNTDRNYTNGVQIAWVPRVDSPPDWAVRVARQIPWFPQEGRVRHGYALGQNMFTPRDITLINPPLEDRPYAGWLYGTVGLGVETGRQLDQLALTLGVVGPASLAEQSQKFVHKVRNKNRPSGWDTQLGNEPGMMLNYQRSWRGYATKTLAGLDFDLTPHVGGALGNVYTYANTGLTMRYGKQLPTDYGPLRIQPSLPGSGFFTPAYKFSWYLFGGFEGRAVARNIFLDGNTFRDSRSVDKKPLVGDLQWGVVMTWGGVRLSYTHAVRTREFKTQTGSDQFGAFSLSMSF